MSEPTCEPKCEVCGAVVPDGYRACSGLSPCWREVYRRDQESRPVYERFVAVGTCSVCGKAGQTPWMDDSKPVCVACLGKQRDEARSRLAEVEEQLKGWQRGLTPHGDRCICVHCVKIDDLKNKLAEVEKEPSKRIDGCQHRRADMARWANEGACPICMTATAGMLRERLAEVESERDRLRADLNMARKTRPIEDWEVPR